MTSETENDGERPLLSWESVLRAGSPENAVGGAEPAAASPPDPTTDVSVDTEPEAFLMPLLDFGIAPISLDPLPPIPQSREPESQTAPDTEPSVLDSFELKIAPFDIPDLTPGGQTPTIVPLPAIEESVEQPAPPEPVIAPIARVASATPGAPPPSTPPTALSASPAQVVATPAAAPQVAPQPDLEPQIATPTLPAQQPTRARAPQVAAASFRAAHVPAPAESRKKQKQAKKSSGGGGFALVFTLLVLAGIIAGAVVFGRPYLFPDDWDPDAKPYGEAVESVRDADIVQPLVINRQASTKYGILMAEHLLGDWEADLPMWRSLALAKGAINAPGLRELVANWTPAYYSPATSEVIVNGALLPRAVDGAVTESMALAAIDQETGWASQLDPASLDASALIEAVAIAESQSVSRQTRFGAAVQPERRIDVAAFLPPVLEYRINAPQAFVEFAESGEVDIAGTSLLALSREPALAATDTLTTSQQQKDRTFWYMVFAAYNSPSDAYAASNALVQSSLATVDRAGVQCTYATFSGTDVAGTPELANVLQTWAITAPVEMAATTSVLPDGAQQLSSCDPGADFESGARFGVAREIARWRSVELAAIENVDPQASTPADRALAVQQVRATRAGLPMLELQFDTTYADSARVARGLVSTNDGSLGTLATEPVGAVLEE